MMLGAIRSWIATRALALLGGALAVALVFGAVQSWRVSSLKADVAQLRTDLKAAKEAASLSEALRAQEQTQDQASYADQSARCEQRVITAIDAARAIQEVTNAKDVPGPAAGDSGRAIVGAGQLRRIIGQTQGGAARLPAGSDGSPQR